MIVEPIELKVLIAGTDGDKDDIYLKFKNDNGEVSVEIVTKDGEWEKYLCTFYNKGLYLNTGINGTGFPTDEQGRITLVN